MDENKKYKISFPDENQNDFPVIEMTGLTIKNAGIPVKRDWGDFNAKLIYIEAL